MEILNVTLLQSYNVTVSAFADLTPLRLDKQVYMSPWVQSIHSSYSRAWAGSSASPPTKVPVLVQSIPIHSISKASVSGSIYVFFIINS